MAKPDKPASDASADDTQNEPAPVGQGPAVIHRAVVTKNVDGLVAQPPPGVHASQLGHVVHGHFAGKGWHVQNGTPVAGLPTEIITEILKSDPKAIAPWAPPPEAVLR